LANSRPAGAIELPSQMIDLLTEALIFSAQSIALAFSFLRTLAPISVVQPVLLANAEMRPRPNV
jgi:hypothetical protein